VNIPRSSPMEEEYTPTIIHVFLTTDHTWIQFQESLEIPYFPTKTSCGSLCCHSCV